MNSKKILLIIVAVVIVAIVGVLAWKGIGNKTGSGSTVPTTGTTTNGAGGQTTGGIGKMTDEIYIEILAQSSVSSGDLKAYASRIKALYEKYDVTEENIKAYASELEKDPQHAGEVGQKYIQRAMELQQTGK